MAGLNRISNKTASLQQFGPAKFTVSSTWVPGIGNITGDARNRIENLMKEIEELAVKIENTNQEGLKEIYRQEIKNKSQKVVEIKEQFEEAIEQRLRHYRYIKFALGQPDEKDIPTMQKIYQFSTGSKEAVDPSKVGYNYARLHKDTQDEIMEVIDKYLSITHALAHLLTVGPSNNDELKLYYKYFVETRLLEVHSERRQKLDQEILQKLGRPTNMIDIAEHIIKMYGEDDFEQLMQSIGKKHGRGGDSSDGDDSDDSSDEYHDVLETSGDQIGGNRSQQDADVRPGPREVEVVERENQNAYPEPAVKKNKENRQIQQDRQIFQPGKRNDGGQGSSIVQVVKRPQDQPVYQEFKKALPESVNDVPDSGMKRVVFAPETKSGNTPKKPVSILKKSENKVIDDDTEFYSRFTGARRHYDQGFYDRVLGRIDPRELVRKPEEEIRTTQNAPAATKFDVNSDPYLRTNRDYQQYEQYFDQFPMLGGAEHDGLMHRFNGNKHAAYQQIANAYIAHPYVNAENIFPETSKHGQAIAQNIIFMLSNPGLSPNRQEIENEMNVLFPQYRLVKNKQGRIYLPAVYLPPNTDVSELTEEEYATGVLRYVRDQILKPEVDRLARNVEFALIDEHKFEYLSDNMQEIYNEIDQHFDAREPEAWRRKTKLFPPNIVGEIDTAPHAVDYVYKKIKFRRGLSDPVLLKDIGGRTMEEKIRNYNFAMQEKATAMLAYETIKENAAKDGTGAGAGEISAAEIPAAEIPAAEIPVKTPTNRRVAELKGERSPGSPRPNSSSSILTGQHSPVIRARRTQADPVLFPDENTLKPPELPKAKVPIGAKKQVEYFSNLDMDLGVRISEAAKGKLDEAHRKAFDKLPLYENEVENLDVFLEHQKDLIIATSQNITDGFRFDRIKDHEVKEIGDQISAASKTIENMRDSFRKDGKLTEKNEKQFQELLAIYKAKGALHKKQYQDVQNRKRLLKSMS
jgi:hypothetical protein